MYKFIALAAFSAFCIVQQKSFAASAAETTLFTKDLHCMNEGTEFHQGFKNIELHPMSDKIVTQKDQDFKDDPRPVGTRLVSEDEKSILATLKLDSSKYKVYMSEFVFTEDKKHSCKLFLAKPKAEDQSSKITLTADSKMKADSYFEQSQTERSYFTDRSFTLTNQSRSKEYKVLMSCEFKSKEAKCADAKMLNASYQEIAKKISAQFTQKIENPFPNIDKGNGPEPVPNSGRQ